MLTDSELCRCSGQSRQPIFCHRRNSDPAFAISLPLEWNDAPAGAKSFALIVEDPDAPSGTFRHWAIYDIDPQRNILPEGTTAGAKTESLGHGVNDFGNPRYDGPQPPRGHGLHHYHFRLLALDVETLHLDEKAPVGEVMEKAKPHILGQAEIVGTFERT